MPGSGLSDISCVVLSDKLLMGVIAVKYNVLRNYSSHCD